MRPQNFLRAPRIRAAAGVLAIGTLSAVAAPVLAAGESKAAVSGLKVADASLSYNQPVEVSGTAARDQAGRSAALEFGSTRSGWRVVDTTTIASDGRYRLSARLTRSGAVRVAVGDVSALRTGPAATATGVERTTELPVSVKARLRLVARELDVLPGRTGRAAGYVLPGRAGRVVRLERLDDRGWRTIDVDRTDTRGRYDLRAQRGKVGSRYVRVTFVGDRTNARTVQRIGTLRSFRESFASRYDIYGGALGCGGTLGYDSMVVAHKSLPCGTRLTVHYRGRTANAVVRDRGPYVGGREFDLAGAVARKLGFDGIGTIYVTA